MVENSPNPNPKLAIIEPDNRLVVLARTLQLRGPRAEAALKESHRAEKRFGTAYLGQAIYRHRSVYRNASGASVWSHFELDYFHHEVSAEAIHDLVVAPQSSEAELLRAEILLTTPSSFIIPRGWHGFAHQAGRQASLEFIAVQPSYLDEYRNVIRDYCGPAAQQLVRIGRFGTFRAMESAAVRYQNPAFGIDWNQVHLCELDPDDFHGFGPEFRTALHKDRTDGDDHPDVFVGLDRMRSVPRWTFNDAVVEADFSLAAEGLAEA
ncbi:hypothetical protein [Fulvimarina sp. MAC8]|uniref:hypothetical protein n=1 Tax=Fulvimarina sp. MAC8 TaxID=3162874 RepID=UPI0032EA9CF1